MLDGYYKGDKSWLYFVNLFPHKEKTSSCAVLPELVDCLKQNYDLAIVIHGIVGAKNCLGWVKTPIPALGILRPVDCLDGKLLIRLQTMLMRMH